MPLWGKGKGTCLQVQIYDLQEDLYTFGVRKAAKGMSSFFTEGDANL